MIMRKKCVFADCNCRRYEESTCLHCDHGAAWHKTVVNKKSVKGDRGLPADDKICIICMVNDKDSLILPCKHLLLCQVCIEKVEECPYCKTKIDARICGIYT